MYTLHKLPKGFVLTSDKEADEKTLTKGEVYLNLDDCTLRKALTGNCWAIKGKRKIIAQQDQIDFSALSEEEQKEIGWFDVEKLSYNWIYDNEDNMPKGYPLKPMEYGFQQGFQKAQELLSDRRFTGEEVMTAMKHAVKYYSHMWDDSDGEKIIQSLSQPKSWSVELEMDCTLVGLGLEDTCKPKLTGGKVKILKLL